MTAPYDPLVQAIAEAVVRKLAEQRPAPPPPVPTETAEAEWLDAKAAARYLSAQPKTLAEWRERGEGPKWHRMGSRSIRYARADLEAFMRGRS